MTSAATAIAAVIGRRVWDSRGRPTVEAEIRLKGGAIGRAIAPSGAVASLGEAVELRDGGTVLGGQDVRKAVAHVNGAIALALQGCDAADQGGLDRRLIELDGTTDKHHLGGNATIAVSLAAAQAAAAAERVPLWQALHLRGDDAEVVLPTPVVQIFGGGAHAGHRVDIQEYSLVCPGARSLAEALDWSAAVYHAAGKLMAAAGRLGGVADGGGWWPNFDGNEEALDAMMQAIELAGLQPGDQVALAIDVAAARLRRPDGLYHLDCDGRTLDGTDLTELLQDWCGRYPILAVEDPLAGDDEAPLASLTTAIGNRVQVVGDDAVVTSAARITLLQAVGACNAALIKPAQAGTVTEARAALDAARAAGWGAMAASRAGDSEDVSIVHLAVGWGIRQLKAGAFARSDRMAKWNELLRIEEQAGERARLAAWPKPAPRETPS